MKQPNIVLIFVDNQPADMMGCSGNDEIHTPNLDMLAAKGMRFDQAYCPNAMCSPCRASVLTGLIQSQHGFIPGLTTVKWMPGQKDGTHLLSSTRFPKD